MLFLDWFSVISVVRAEFWYRLFVFTKNVAGEPPTLRKNYRLVEKLTVTSSSRISLANKLGEAAAQEPGWCLGSLLGE